MLGWKQVQNIIIFSQLVQALTCDCRIASWHIPPWLPPSWMGSHPPDCSSLLAAERSLSFTVTSTALLASLSPSAPNKQNTVNNGFFTSQRFSSGKNERSNICLSYNITSITGSLWTLRNSESMPSSKHCFYRTDGENNLQIKLWARTSSIQYVLITL